MPSLRSVNSSVFLLGPVDTNPIKPVQSVQTVQTIKSVSNIKTGTAVRTSPLIFKPFG
jgi:hypothetical protein